MLLNYLYQISTRSSAAVRKTPRYEILLVKSQIQNNKNEIIIKNKNFYSKRTQDLKTKYYDAGQFYLASKKTWLNNKIPKKIGIKIPNWRVVDIDTLSDWKKAEIIFRFIKDNKRFLKKFL